MTLYILDDDALELRLWAHTLDTREPSIEYRLFNSAEEFKGAVAACPPDEAIVDFVLPFSNGAEICKWLRAEYPQVKVYVNTSLSGDEYQVLAERCSAVYMCKSLTFPERLKVVCNGCKS